MHHNPLLYNFSLPGRHSFDWFPTGFGKLEDIIDSELAVYNDTGVTAAMMRDARRCCPWCTIASIKRGKLTFKGDQGGKPAASVRLLRKLHAEKPLPDVELILAHHDIWTPPDHEASYCAGKLLPVFSHTRSRIPWPQAADGKNILSWQRGVLTIPENTFFQSYGKPYSAGTAHSQRLFLTSAPSLTILATTMLACRRWTCF